MSMSRDGYQTAWLLDERSRRGHIVASLEELKQRRGIRGCDVVELGSGIGTNLRVFAAQCRVLGLESLPDAVATALGDGLPTLYADLEGPPWPLADASVDWLLCIDVLEHLLRPEDCLRQAVRLLRPTGRIVINIPNHFDWRGRLRIAFGAGIDSQRYFAGTPVWRYPHLRFLRRRDLVELLDSVGLAIEEDLSPSNSSVPKAEALRRMGLGGLSRALTRAWPELFAPGFLFLCRSANATQ